MITRWIPLWVIPVLIAVAIGTVWLRLAIVRTSYSINQTDKSLRNFQHEREKIELKLAGLRSPRRLENLATKKFGLTKPRADQVVYLK
ncbi:MAG: hypothetical protein A3K03_06570 [Bdellovibrionales bacterium RIFOXYD1_FULL_44_7]|nr:MAG: hypothetical protein A3K03_06570 [Bdellovibrionales bacterium RIFOXYD1_FULL_44_7]